jgi:hypothetical protein
MNSIEGLREFLGWCSVINIGILLLSSVIVMAMRGPISNIHSKMFGLGKEDLLRAYFQYLGHYKIVIIVLNIVPYIALVIMAQV